MPFLHYMYLLSSNCLPLISPSKHFFLDMPMLVNKQNKTALDLAVENTYESIIELLELASVNSTLLNSHISSAINAECKT